MAKHGNLVVQGGTHIGRQRSSNDDAFFVGKLQRSIFVQDSSLSKKHETWLSAGDEGWLLIVADGMGGQGNGDLASKAAIEAVTRYLCNTMPWFVIDADVTTPTASLPGLREKLVEAVGAGETNVRLVATQPNVSARMGTTLTLAYVLWPNLYVAHVGDSRCYLLRGGHLNRLTTDHTLAQNLAAEGLKNIAPSSPWHHILWNAIGGDEQQAQPEVTRTELTEQDQILLCSDGLTRHIDDRTILEILSTGKSVGESCNRLIAAANDAGGTDNTTVIVAKFVPATDSASPTPS